MSEAEEKDIAKERCLNENFFDDEINQHCTGAAKKHSLKNKDQYETVVRDLHDTLQQTLLVLNLKLQKAKMQFPEVYDSKVIDESLDYSKLALTQLKKILSGEEESSENPLNEQLCKMAEKLAQTVDFKIKIENLLKSEFPIAKSSEVVKTIYEVLNNAIKYSNARHLFIQLSENKEKLFIKIEDDGDGFDQTKVIEGRGFRNIRHRIQQIEGDVQISSHPGKGTTIHISMHK